MAQKTKKDSGQSAQNMSKVVFKMMLGLGFVILGGVLAVVWKWQLQVVLKGLSGLLLILVGAIIIAVARD